MDISLSTNPDPTSDKDFTVLSTIPDYYAHFQAAQKNFSIAVTIPNISTFALTNFSNINRLPSLRYSNEIHAS